ncbi:hypothetical protein ACIF6L_31580 [Kitasatospora sp. NPDC086009]|uniref:hypothetical protein n=1 Tax=unclassified Kitasatospora TaxID=2633591 RepID=UPI0037CBB2AA
MTKRIARTLATTVLAAGIVAVPAAGSAFASSHGHSGRGGGSEQFYNHQVQAGTEHVYYSESTTYYSSNDCDEYRNGGYGNGGLGNSYGHGNGYNGGGILGLGLLGL